MPRRPHLLAAWITFMKRALTGLASVGILAVTVGVETANAQSYRRYGPARTYTSQAYTPKDPARFAARAVCALLRFPTRTVRKPPAVVALATIEPFRTGERKRRRGAHRRSRAAKMTNQPRTVANKVMILPTESGYTDDNAHNLWKRASNLRKRSPHMGVICSRTCRPRPSRPTMVHLGEAS
jgi:hypothetical protein